jgi:UDP-glucose 4-epimerase
MDPLPARAADGDRGRSFVIGFSEAAEPDLTAAPRACDPRAGRVVRHSLSLLELCAPGDAVQHRRKKELRPARVAQLQSLEMSGELAKKVLLTGSEGLVGRECRGALETAGFQVVPFDRVAGQELRNVDELLRATAECVAVVHAGALAHDTAGTPAEIMATNLLGTWHVLLAAEAQQVERVVYFSSGQVFGFAEGEGVPAYLPVDDRHPVRAARPYGLSKRLAEEMCEAWTARTSIPTVVLRPVLILNDAALETTTENAAELGAYVHVDDVAAAVVKALTRPIVGHHRVTLCGPGQFDTSAAQALLDWHAERQWPAQDPMSL